MFSSVVVTHVLYLVKKIRLIHINSDYNGTRIATYRVCMYMVTEICNLLIQNEQGVDSCI